MELFSGMHVQVYVSVHLPGSLPFSLSVHERVSVCWKGENLGGAALDYYFITASYCSWLHSPRGFPPTHSHVVTTAHRGDDSPAPLLLSSQLAFLILLIIQDLRVMRKSIHSSIKNAED